MREVEHPSYEVLLQYADHSVPAEQAFALREHLASCPLCLNEFLLISEELFPGLEKPLAASELLRNKLLHLIAAFEEACRAAGTLAPLFRLTPVRRPEVVVAGSAGSMATGRMVRIDLHKDPRLPYVTILKEGEGHDITVLGGSDYWVNIEVSGVDPIQRLPAVAGATRLFAIYTAVPVPVESGGGAAGFLGSLQAGEVEYEIASTVLHP